MKKINDAQMDLIDRIGRDYQQFQTMAKGSVSSRVNPKIQGVSWGLGGALIMLIFSNFVLMPRQVSLARGLDAVALDSLNTPSGRVLRHALNTTSLESCLRRGKKQTGKAVCLLDVK